MDLREHVQSLATVAPLSDISPDQRRELDSVLGGAETVEDLPGKWQAAVLKAELRAAGEEPAGGHGHCCGGH
jgi:hypothetical protein